MGWGSSSKATPRRNTIIRLSGNGYWELWLRLSVILLLILVALYTIASIYYLASDLASRQARNPENTPNLANLPKNMSKQDIYLTYRVKGYVNISGGLVYIDNAQLGMVARYTEAPLLNSTINSTVSIINATDTYYRVEASGDPALIVALRELLAFVNNISSANLSLIGGWRSSNISDIFGNLSLFTKTGEGMLAGRGGSGGIAYAEYRLERYGGSIVIWVDESTGVPIQCRIRTNWASLDLSLQYAS
jgi:hypothetical protein